MGLLDDFDFGNFGAGLSRSVVIDSLGAPVDVVSWALNKGISGLNNAFNQQFSFIEKPFLGSDWIADRFRNNTPWKDNPGSKWDSVGQVASLAIPFLPKVQKIANLSLPKVDWFKAQQFFKDIADASMQARSGVSYVIPPKDLKRIREQLEKHQKGIKTKPIVIENPLTEQQFNDLVNTRKSLDLPYPDTPNFKLNGKHWLESRRRDGYTIDEMVDHIDNAFSDTSVVTADYLKRVGLQNIKPRIDAQGNVVYDRVAFELSDPKQPEIFSVIPKGDKKKKGLK